MSRVRRRTFPTRAGIGGTKARMARRLALRATAVGALHEVNRPGTKVAKRMARAKGANAKGMYFHGGELTLASYNRDNPFPAKTHREMLERRGVVHQKEKTA